MSIDEPDLIDELITERSAVEPAFSALVDAALEARLLVRALADIRRDSGLSQTVVAARMGTSQSALARIESGEHDPRLTTVIRFAHALGASISISSDQRDARWARGRQGAGQPGP